MLDELAGDLKFRTERLNELERTPSFSMEMFQLMFVLVMSTIPGEKVLKVDESRKW